MTFFQDRERAMLFLFEMFQPVNMYPPTQAGFCDVFGNVWEWVEDHVNGFCGFKSRMLYDDFSTPFFDGKHNMIMVRSLKYIRIELLTSGSTFHLFCVLDKALPLVL